MNNNKYLDRLNEIYKSENFKKIRFHTMRGRRHYKYQGETLRRISVGDPKHRKSDYNYAQWRYAHAEMKEAIEKGNIELALNAFRRYENLGKANASYVLNGLLKTLEKANSSNKDLSNLEELRKIFDEHGKQATKTGKLESALEAVLIMSVLGSILFLSPNLTSNVIVDLSTKTTSLIGALLFIIALFAGFIWLRKKRLHNSK